MRATFKIVGEKARVLERRGRARRDCRAPAHDIGYHSNTHSQQPTVAVYLQNAGWDDGRAEFYRREAQGVRDVERIFGVTPVAYGQPGSAWAPQTYPALRDMGIDVYLDEADHVGIDDQPFYYGGMLNVFKMRSNLARMDLTGGASLAEGQGRVHAASTRGCARTAAGRSASTTTRTNGCRPSSGTRSTSATARIPPRRVEAAGDETRRRDRAGVPRLRAVRPLHEGTAGVRFVTATDLKALYEDAGAGRTFAAADLQGLARSMQKEITFQRFDRYALSSADVFGLLTDAMAAFIDAHALPAGTKVAPLDGPVRAFHPGTGGSRSPAFRWTAFAAAVRDAAAFCRTQHRVPDEVWIGSENLSPADFLATLSGAFDAVVASGKAPAEVARVEGHFTADRYVADDSPALWSWPIFPEGFHAPGVDGSGTAAGVDVEARGPEALTDGKPRRETRL